MFGLCLKTSGLKLSPSFTRKCAKSKWNRLSLNCSSWSSCDGLLLLFQVNLMHIFGFLRLQWCSDGFLFVLIGLWLHVAHICFMETSLPFCPHWNQGAALQSDETGNVISPWINEVFWTWRWSIQSDLQHQASRPRSSSLLLFLTSLSCCPHENWGSGGAYTFTC